MKQILTLLLLITAAPFLFAQDIEGSKDHPIFNRITGFNITEFNVEEFGTYTFTLDGESESIVEGTKTTIHYECDCEEAPLKIVRNFTNAIKNIGGSIYEPFKNRGYMFLKQGNKETWAEVYAGDYYYDLTIVEKGEVEQEITANTILKELNETGKAILYINFDSGKSTIKKESMPIVEQIIEMMNQVKDIKLSVEGHTDSDGSNESNLKLSEARAKAVVEAITKGGIDAARLSSAGFGEEKSMADNSTSEGKAKNRRVELIKK